MVFSENPPSQSRDGLPVVSRGDAPVPCSKAEETTQLPLYGLVSKSRWRARIPRGQRPMAILEQFWAHRSFPRQIHLQPPNPSPRSEFPNPDPSAPQCGHHFPQSAHPSAARTLLVSDLVRPRCSSKLQQGRRRDPHCLRQWRCWPQLGTDGPLSRTWQRLSSASDSPNHRWCRHGRGDDTILH